MERKATDLALRASETRYRQLAETRPGGASKNAELKRNEEMAHLRNR
jgi:hypothetical protein